MSTATPPVSPDAFTWTPRRHPEPRPSSFRLPSALSLLHFASVSSAAERPLRPSFPRRLRPSQPAKSFTRASSTSASPPWSLSSTGKAALPSSEPFSLARVLLELTGAVARTLCSTISLHSCSYRFHLARREPQPGRHRLCTPVYRPQHRRAAIHAGKHPRVQ